jgi:hypothetical protein
LHTQIFGGKRCGIERNGINVLRIEVGELDFAIVTREENTARVFKGKARGIQSSVRRGRGIMCMESKGL